MACDARWPRAERGGQMSLYGCLSAFADVHSRGWNDGYAAVSCRSRLTSSEFMAPKRLRHV